MFLAPYSGNRSSGINPQNGTIRYKRLSIPYTDSRGNLRHYYPDFVVVDDKGVSYLVETKGREDIEVANKDRSATIWAEQATALTGQEWRYLKVLQTDFQELTPTSFSECAHLSTV